MYLRDNLNELIGYSAAGPAFYQQRSLWKYSMSGTVYAFDKLASCYVQTAITVQGVS